MVSTAKDTRGFPSGVRAISTACFMVSGKVPSTGTLCENARTPATGTRRTRILNFLLCAKTGGRERNQLGQHACVVEFFPASRYEFRHSVSSREHMGHCTTREMEPPDNLGPREMGHSLTQCVCETVRDGDQIL